MSVIGLLSSLAAGDADVCHDPFRQGLNGAGYVESSNVTIEYRWATGCDERDDVLAARRVSVVKALGRPASEVEIAEYLDP